MAFTIKLRGAPGGTIQHEYMCPVHGRFTAEVPRADVPDEVFCPVVDGFYREGHEEHDVYCGRTSPWSPSGIACKISGIGFSRGKADAPPTPHALSTRALAEGMPMNEWRAQRAKLREERRRKRIKEIR